MKKQFNIVVIEQLLMFFFVENKKYMEMNAAIAVNAVVVVSIMKSIIKKGKNFFVIVIRQKENKNGLINS